MNTRQYLYFHTLGTSNTISDAARRLNISEAALSKFIKCQEEYYHVSLFSRKNKKLVLTEAGQIMFDTSQRILDTKSNTMAAIAHLENKRERSIRIASTPFRGTELYGRIYNRYLSLFPTAVPQVTEIYSSQQEKAVHEQQIDFAFGVGLHKDYQDVYNLATSRTEIMLAVPRFHPLVSRIHDGPESAETVSIIEFEKTPFILRDRKNNIRLEADKVFAAAGFTPVIAFESSNAIAVESMIRRGAGVGFFSKRYVHMEDNLVFFHLNPPCYETFYIRYSRDHKISDEEKCLIAIIRQERLQTRGSEPIENPFINECLRILSEYEGEKLHHEFTSGV